MMPKFRVHYDGHLEEFNRINFDVFPQKIQMKIEEIIFFDTRRHKINVHNKGHSFYNFKKLSNVKIVAFIGSVDCFHNVLLPSSIENLSIIVSDGIANMAGSYEQLFHLLKNLEQLTTLTLIKMDFGQLFGCNLAKIGHLADSLKILDVRKTTIFSGCTKGLKNLELIYTDD